MSRHAVITTQGSVGGDAPAEGANGDDLLEFVRSIEQRLHRLETRLLPWAAADGSYEKAFLSYEIDTTAEKVISNWAAEPERGE